MMSGYKNYSFPRTAPLTISVAILLIYSAWARGGTRPELQPPFLWMAIAVFLILLTEPLWTPAATQIVADSGNKPSPTPDDPAGTLHIVSQRIRNVLRRAGRIFLDPVFWMGVGLTVLLIIQWRNSGRYLAFDFSIRKWHFKPAPDPNLPWSFRPKEALEMIRWFVPAYALLLAVRHGFDFRRQIRLLFTIMVFNAAILSFFGIVQFMSGTESIFWITPLPVYFFASFGYPNHAASFFVLHMCVGIGLILTSGKAYKGRHGKRTSAMRSLLIGAVVLCLIGANLSFSRAGILMSWTVVLITIVRLFAGPLTRPLKPSQKFNAGITCLILLIATYTVLYMTAAERMSIELNSFKNKHVLNKEFEARFWQIDAAYHMWLDHPWYGVGGWGYRYILHEYVPREKRKLITTGKANVHHDAVQFLAEFGTVGFVLLFGTLVVLLIPIRKKRLFADDAFFFTLAGLGLVIVHSQIDLPFRSPAILYAWLTVLAALGRTETLSPRRSSHASP